jgi:hypothetical protein
MEWKAIHRFPDSATALSGLRPDYFGSFMRLLGGVFMFTLKE